MEGGTTFPFVSDGIESALTQAKDAAQGRDIWLAGGASVANQYLAARLVDEIDVSIAPWILGAGARLFEGLERETLNLKQTRAIDAPGVTHIKNESRLTRFIKPRVLRAGHGETPLRGWEGGQHGRGGRRRRPARCGR
jgi:dihydrofolate reductase